ncbi:MAG: hypothetical protein ILM98_09470 [Kiritimatiellae bacterium]|nr:hypothetical protein [Kiritimatiellia bacterium]
MLKKATASLNPASRAAALGIAAFVAATSATRPALAADATFPNTDGNGDLASAASWGLEAVPDASTRVVFTKAMTATASEDISFAGIYHNGEQKTVTLDMRDAATGANPGPRMINLTDSIQMGTKWYETLKIQGGTWNLNNKHIRIWNGSNYDIPVGPAITISGGACVTSVNTLQGAYGPQSRATIVISGEGTVVTAAVLKVAGYNAGTNVVRVANGAELVVTGTANENFHIGPGNSFDCGLIVTNGARFVKTSSADNAIGYISGTGKRNYIRVLDGATAQIKGLFFLGYGNTSTSGNTILASGTNATLGANSTLTMDQIYIGHMNSSDQTKFNSGNTIQALDGATFLADNVTLYGSGNGIVVSNALADLKGANGMQCSALSTNCYVRLQGSTPRFRMSAQTGSGNFALANSFKFIYDLPPEGYAAGFVPVQIQRWGTTDGMTELVFNGIAEMQTSMRARNVRKASYTVLNFRGGVSGTGAALLAKWNAALPEGAKLTADGSYQAFTLNVEVDLKRATTIVFR